MKIKGIDNLDIGMSNIEIEGEVTYTMTPRFVEGDNDKGHYEFYSQFVVIEDETGKIGCSITITKEEHKLVKGVIARVKGKLEEYKDKKGQMVKKIQGKLVGISKGDKVTDVQQEVAEEYFEEKAKEEKSKKVIIKEEKAIPVKVKANGKENNEYYGRENYWQDKHEWDKHTWKYNRVGMSRSNGVNYAISMIDVFLKNKIIEPKEEIVMGRFWTLSGFLGKYIFNGEKPNSGNKKVTPLEKAIKGERQGKLEIISEDPLFPAEEIENAVNEKEKEIYQDEESAAESNSYNKPLPFKGKRKKITNAKDFIAAKDMPDLL